MRNLRFLSAVLILACSLQGVHAQEVEPENRQKIESDLTATMEALRSATKARKELEARSTKLLGELKGLQKELVGITDTIRKQEKLLSELETNLLDARDEEWAMTANLAKRQKEQEDMVQGMIRLSRVPPETVIAMPGDFAHTLRTAKVLSLTSQALTQQAAKIRKELEEIQTLQAVIRDNHEQISKQKLLLEKNEKELTARLETRSAIQSQLLSQQEEREAEVQRLSQQSSTLKELMAELEKHRSEAAKKAEKLAMVPVAKPDIPTAGSTKSHTGKAKTKKSTPPASFAQAKGKISLPAEGQIFTFYGNKTDDGSESRGISIRTRAGAKVTSPFAGEVVYTGTFMDYGKMVILRHGENYHSLLAGISTISARLGQRVIAGEPIGEMGRNEEETALYMEIREHNRPVDPLNWLEQREYATKRQLLR